MGEISTTNNNKFTYIIVMSIAMMLSLIIIPFSTGWLDGLIPEVDDLGHGLFDVLQELAEDGEDAWRSVIVRGTLLAAICDVIMFLASACKIKTMSILSSLGGIITMIWSLLMYINLNDFDAVFDFDDCGTTIGFWIPFILFIICFIVAVRLPSETDNTSVDTQIEINTNNEMEVNDMDFFYNLGKKISQTSQSAVEKTKIFTATTKLNLDINEAKNQITEYYRQIGEIYFANYQNNPSAKLLDLVGKIKEKLSEIDKMTAQIVELKGVTICPQCGAEVPADTSFCGKCGCKVQIEPLVTDTTPKCPQCGSEINGDSQFCGNCGCKIEHQQIQTNSSVEG